MPHLQYKPHFSFWSSSSCGSYRFLDLNSWSRDPTRTVRASTCPCAQATLLARQEESSGCQKGLCKSRSQLPVRSRPLALGHHPISMGRNVGHSRQHRAHHCASATVLPPVGRAEVLHVSCQHMQLPALMRAAQDHCWRACAARKGSLR